MRNPALAGAVLAPLLLSAPGAATEVRAVVDTYADIALAKYEDSLLTAQGLQSAVATLIATPSAAALQAAKAAWLHARVPYQQTEVYRFGNVIVDEWEGKVNAWPLDEGLIDYVDATFYGSDSDINLFYTANIIANPSLTVGGQEIDATTIDAALIQSLHELDAVEANVATGYHAIEFLLWGQDLNGTGPGAGARPWTDYASGADCTSGNCDRRRAYLMTAADLLVTDLEDMVANWQADGDARTSLETASPQQGLATILTGMGSLSYGEQAGERMKLGLMLHDPEEEHDCFSDNTHNSHFYDVVGIQNVYLGIYRRLDGTLVTGPSLSGLVAARDPELDAAMRADLDRTLAEMGTLKRTADSGIMAYDQMIAAGNTAGNALVQNAIDALVDQTGTIERVVAALELGRLQFEGSDSLDNPQAVFQ